jgi:hypothetical protein
MDPTRILHHEVLGFLLGLCALIAYRMLTRQIKLGGLFSDGSPGGQVTAERVQLLMATLALSAKFVQSAMHGSSVSSLPDVSVQWLVVFGASSGVYASVKAWKMFRVR